MPHHCATCTCRPILWPTTSDVRFLPVDLDRHVTYRLRSGATGTNHCLQFVQWKPDEHSYFRRRVRQYGYLVRYGDARNIREAVKMLAIKRREWLASEAARHAEVLSRKYTGRKSGYERALPRKKEMVLAGGQPCAYCGVANPRSVDHIVPPGRGGDHRRKNLAPACGSCNSEKNDRTPLEWREWRLRLGLCWPPPPQVAAEGQIDARFTGRKITDTQSSALETASVAGGAGDGLWMFQLRTIRALERNELIAPARPHSAQYVITDRGRLALESGRVPR